MKIDPWSKFYLSGVFAFDFPAANSRYRIMVQVGNIRRFLFDRDWWLWGVDEDVGREYQLKKITDGSRGTHYWLRVDSNANFNIISNWDEEFPYSEAQTNENDGGGGGGRQRKNFGFGQT